MEKRPGRPVEPIPSLLPAPEHIAYVANLLTVMAVLLGAWLVWKKDHARARANVPAGWSVA